MEQIQIKKSIKKYKKLFVLNNKTNLNKVSLLAYLINLGVSVPHYCYHNNLSIASNCRICIVEMGNLPKPIVSCVVSAGTSLFNYEIYHNSRLVKKARENFMEFLLLNHADLKNDK